MPITSVTPPSTNSTVNSPEYYHHRHHDNRITRKRNRVPLSCAACRHRKLKCNRGQPCDNCVKRGGLVKCEYAIAPVRKRGSMASTLSSTPDDMQNRIDRLENLVLSLMNTGTQGSATAANAAIERVYSGQSTDDLVSSSRTNTSPLDPRETSRDDDCEQDEDEEEVNDVSQGIGLMRVNNGKTYFIPNTHWYPQLLSDIAELRAMCAKSNFEEHSKKVKASGRDDAPGADYFFKAPRLGDKSELLASLPTKSAMDRLIARYFECYEPGLHIVHGPTFQTLYDAHWANPRESPPVFISMLFALMTIALQSYQKAPGEASEYPGNALELANKYRRLTAQGLILADIRDNHRGLLETLLLHLQAETTRSRDTESGILMLNSLICRHAMKLGYHRDPSHYGNISLYEGEMRRRVWAAIRLVDYMYSFQCGLPALIRSDCVDAQLPRNLFDDELHEGMTALPPSRPEHEATPMSYMLARTKLGLLFGNVHDRVSTLRLPPSYDEVMELDSALREARGQLPVHLRFKSVQESVQEPPNLIVQRLSLEMMYLKTLCILHRRFIARGRGSARYAASRQTCIDAAMDTLSHNATLHFESRPGGRLHSVKWNMMPVTPNDILSAAMIICVDLNNGLGDERSAQKSISVSADGEAWVQHHREEMIDALRTTMRVWESRLDSSMEAFKGFSIVGTMVDKLMKSQAQYDAKVGNPPSAPMDIASMASVQALNGGNVRTQDNVAPEHSAAMTLGLLSAGGVSPGQSLPLQRAEQLGGAQVADGRVGYAGMSGDGVSDRSGMPGGYGVGPMDFSTAPVAQMLDNVGLDGIPTDIDWGVWDSYIQGPSMDPMSMWPTMDMSAIDPEIQGQSSQQQQQAPDARIISVNMIDGMGTV